MAKKIQGCWRLLMSLLLLTPCLLSAQRAQNCGCGEVSIKGEALYWATSQCDFFFAFKGESVFVIPEIPAQEITISGDYENQIIEPDYDWGFRIGLHYTRECWLVRTQYLWLETNSQKTVERGNLNTLVTPLLAGISSKNQTQWDTVTGSTEEIYQNFDLALGREFFRTCSTSLSFLSSAQAICIRDRRRVRAFGETQLIVFPPEPPPIELPAPINGEYNLDTNFWSFGLGVGPLLRAELGCGFSLVGEGQLLGLIGYKRVKLKNRSLVSNETGTRYTDFRWGATHTPRTSFVPGLKGRLALEYCYELCCGTLCGHIGYEDHFYYTIVQAAQEGERTLERPSNTQAIVKNAGFGGLNLGLTFSY